MSLPPREERTRWGLLVGLAVSSSHHMARTRPLHERSVTLLSTAASTRGRHPKTTGSSERNQTSTRSEPRRDSRPAATQRTGPRAQGGRGVTRAPADSDEEEEVAEVGAAAGAKAPAPDTEVPPATAPTDA
ncbi:hypothetical protein Taro_010076 [Colocasia esculenta]|uniref:Uncharacterized protein n=1 Tax=Colocasia esculenta TaxID=4460 RepID=A0A843TXZ1_COLES|nr:hypothetical protein [Colocasia esculenta]